MLACCILYNKIQIINHFPEDIFIDKEFNAEAGTKWAQNLSTPQLGPMSFYPQKSARGFDHIAAFSDCCRNGSDITQVCRQL